MPLGSLLGLSKALLRTSGPRRPEKTFSFLRFLKIQVFGSLKLSMALLGSSWLLL